MNRMATFALTMLAASALTTPALAQSHDDDAGHEGHAMPASTPAPVNPAPDVPTQADPHAGHAMPATTETASVPQDAMDGMDHSAMDHSAMDHGTMDHGTMDHGTMDHGTMDHGAMDDALEGLRWRRFAGRFHNEIVEFVVDEFK